MKNIFVYGTLKKGYGNNRLLAKAEFVAEITMSGYKLYESGIPYMKRSNNKDDKVRGELYQFEDERILQNLDSLEGHPTWYRREELEDGIEGYIYLPKVSCPESPKVDGVYVYGRERRY